MVSLTAQVHYLLEDLMLVCLRIEQFKTVNICFSFFIRWTTQEIVMLLLTCRAILSA
uniref:Uncharacterized protein n=1 Tax=Arundo donax TaxID=35708 RepID=A0A0A9CFY9_ARUDO